MVIFARSYFAVCGRIALARAWRARYLRANRDAFDISSNGGRGSYKILAGFSAVGLLNGARVESISSLSRERLTRKEINRFDAPLFLLSLPSKLPYRTVRTYVRIALSISCALSLGIEGTINVRLDSRDARAAVCASRLDKITDASAMKSRASAITDDAAVSTFVPTLAYGKYRRGQYTDGMVNRMKGRVEYRNSRRRYNSRH